MSKTKYIFITGGVVSSLGKGIAGASLGKLLNARGLKVSIQKFDPYINLDPGTMSPYQHGEVFVTDDGAETDLDLGHYERFIDKSLTKSCNVTAGKIYWSVLNKERKGKYLGKTVQVIPHITDEIKNRIKLVDKEEDLDIIITEIGGTVGDIESLPFLEAIRQFKRDIGRENVLYIHMTLIPYLGAAKEAKTKPTQHSVKELRGLGIQPDVILCRASSSMKKDMIEKIALFCDIEKEAVIEVLDAKSIYEVPLNLQKCGLDNYVLDRLKLEAPQAEMREWTTLVEKALEAKEEINIGLVGKYVKLHDAYLSVVEALNHSGFYHGKKIKIKWINSDKLSKSERPEEIFHGLDGILVPGGFGHRGVDGKIFASKYARENNVPYFGICLGMQTCVIDFARNVLGIKDANSSELNGDGENSVIDLMLDQKNITDKGGTMRLGSYDCLLKSGSLAKNAYGVELIKERHRHRYEFNNEYRALFESNGLKITGLSPDGRLVEIVEGENLDWFLACQFHPEFKSRLNNPHPLFREFIGAAIRYSKKP